MNFRYFGLGVILLLHFACSYPIPPSDNSKSEKEVDSLRQALNILNRENTLKRKEEELSKREDSLKVYSSQRDKKSLADNYQDIKNAIFLIYTSDDTTISQGSAVVVSPKGIAISNYHVFGKANRAIAVNSNGEKFLISRIFDYDRDKDFIIFQLGPSIRNFDFVKIASKFPRIGESCFAVGNPIGLAQTLSSGIISGYRGEDSLIQTTAEITHGSSGGGLFNNDGEVIGITSSGMDQANLNFALNINQIPYQKFLLDDADIVNENRSPESSVATDQEKLKVIVTSYYHFFQTQDYSSVLELYADTINRFFDWYNISKEKALSGTWKSMELKGIKVSEVDIDWNSFIVSKNDVGYLLTFTMLYIIERNEVNKPTHFNLNMTFEFNLDFKITSVYENILKKY